MNPEGAIASSVVLHMLAKLIGRWKQMCVSELRLVNINRKDMIDKQKMTTFVESYIADTEYFLVDVQVTTNNIVSVEIDHASGVDINFCEELSRAIGEEFDRDVEDYELEVGSAGLTSPFKVKGQYLKNIGREVEVLACDGKKYKGELAEVTDSAFAIVCKEKVKKEGAKRPVIEDVMRRFEYNQVKSTKYLLQF